jgi:uncharacterized membrane protein
MGDTLASELGILSSSPPILLTTLKTVPPGTNGALSLIGTAASIGGGMAMGWIMWAALSVENAACRDQTGDLFLLLLGWGAVAGGLGSLVRIKVQSVIGTRVSRTDTFGFGGAQLDSLLGATLQRTQYSNTSKRILTDTSTVPQDGSDIKVVSGLDMLSNNHVRTSASTHAYFVLTSHSLGQPYLLDFDCISAGISRLAKKGEFHLVSAFFPPLSRRTSERRHFDTGLCIFSTTTYFV